MKTSILPSGVCSILAALLVVYCSGGIADEVPVQVTFDLLVVDLSQESAVALVPELRDHRRAAKAVQRLMKMIAEKKATLVGWPIITAKSGQRASVEQIDEFRYATQYDAPGHATVTETYPDSDETLGAPVVPSIQKMPLVPQHMRFLGMKKIEIEQKGSGKKTVVEQPQFATNKVTTSITVKDGDYTLLGVFKMPESPG